MTLAEILHDTENKCYRIRVSDSTGLVILHKREFATEEEAIEVLKELGLDGGEEIPVTRQ
jgi:RPA family protein